MNEAIIAISTGVIAYLISCAWDFVVKENEELNK